MQAIAEPESAFPIYSQLILRIYAAMNGQGGGAKTLAVLVSTVRVRGARNSFVWVPKC